LILRLSGFFLHTVCHWYCDISDYAEVADITAWI
jgi:hypothetical protein